MVPLLLSLILLATAQDVEIFNADTATYGQLYSIHSAPSGMFVLSLSLRTFHVSWASDDSSLACTTSEEITTSLLVDVKVFGSTLYFLGSLDTQTFLWSFSIDGGECVAVKQWTYTSKGKVVYGFLLNAGTVDCTIGLVDTKRDFFLAAFNPATQTTEWSQVRSLVTVDTDAGDATGTLNKAIPDHAHDQASDLVVYLDKTGKSIMFRDFENLTI